MRIDVRYFGVLRETFGGAGESVELPDGSDVGELVRVLEERTSNQTARSVAPWSALAVAVNREYAGRGTVLRDGDEVALLPPVSGGTDAG